MAIGPYYLEKNLNREVQEFEKLIDEKLSRLKVLQGSSVNVDVPEGMTYIHYQAMKKNYIEAGWKEVEWNSSQRDGSFLTFNTVKSNTNNDFRDSVFDPR